MGVWVLPASAASKPSAKQWADGVCSAIQTFGQSVQSSISGLKNASSLDDASQKAKSSLDDATQELVNTMQKLGKPPTSGGKKAQQALQDLSKQLEADANQVKQLLSSEPSTPQEIASTFTEIGSVFQEAVSQVRSTASDLKGLKDGTLRKAFQNAPSCKELKNAQ